MAAKSWLAFLLSAALVTAFSPTAMAQRGGRGGGGGGGGGGGSGGGSAAHSFGGSGNVGGGGGGAKSFSGGGNVGGQRSGDSGQRNWSGGGQQQWSNQSPTFRGQGVIDQGKGSNQNWSQNSGNWDHNQKNWDHNQNWNKGGNWDRDWYGRNWYGWGFTWPGYGYAWWPGYGYGYYGGYNPWYNSYGYTAPYYGYSEPYYGNETVPYTAAYPPDTTAAIAPSSGGESTDFYQQAVAAFRQGDYRNSVRLAGHASIDDGRNPNVHMVLMLGLFATGDYRGAAMEAHAVAALGKVPDWATLFGFYGAVEPYTEQLRKLEQFTRDNPKAAEAKFLLGFQYMMEGHRESAQKQFTEALTLAPTDRLAAKLLTDVGGTVPPEIAAELARRPNAPGAPQQGLEMAPQGENVLQNDIQMAPLGPSGSAPEGTLQGENSPAR